MVKSKNNKSKLSWTRYFFYNFKRRKSIIGYNVSTIYRTLGRVSLIEGTCLSKYGKNDGLLNSSILVRRKIGSSFLFTRFFVYFGCFCKYMTIGFTFKNKNIKFSKISFKRYN